MEQRNLHQQPRWMLPPHPPAVADVDMLQWVSRSRGLKADGIIGSVDVDVSDGDMTAAVNVDSCRLCQQGGSGKIGTPGAAGAAVLAAALSHTAQSTSTAATCSHTGGQPQTHRHCWGWTSPPGC